MKIVCGTEIYFIKEPSAEPKRVTTLNVSETSKFKSESIFILYAFVKFPEL